ncbi:MAG: DUF4258 domain-containing protein [Syntrophothermus sp.]|uniref:DUF4258 domain-containing protein n=1 Tax=Syntrophothermus sp. TaxID=2736299 RepID=UPI00257D04F4|nr:DUF4258 domain-containing protein [Syntrophothermus sp.]NSW84442.1 DUF4258 domain-containing protein [Syntrophothermus sp.]
MDPRNIIREAATEEAYEITTHCLEEMDKDGISIEQVEWVMQHGQLCKVDRKRNRYTLKARGIMISVEVIAKKYVTIITAGRERR